MDGILGYLTIILCVFALLGKKFNKYVTKIKNSKFSKLHCFIGAAAFIVSTVHFIINSTYDLLTIGSVAWLFLLIVCILGIMLTRTKGKKRQTVFVLHWGISVLMIAIAIFHILIIKIL